ncbi:MAG TPA: GTP-binding protein [Acidobacteriaceae bacterium]|nr:GTP-binding protein [Acidobacteriaceae bacterium]
MSEPPATPWLVTVGGFLGAGKTTLILAAARELERRGFRSAVIMNDQGSALVDSSFAGLSGMRFGEVAGGCFCCRLSDLIHVMGELRAHRPDVIFAEPVGSCTDISATVLHPLLDEGGSLRIAPLTVLVDPARANELWGEDGDSKMRFLLEKQLQEADILCLTKSDLGVECRSLGSASVRRVSARSGQGIAAWLDEVLSGEIAAGSRLLEIDYEEYARAEASLAWLNLRADFEPERPISPPMLMGPLFDHLDAALTAAGISIVHLKAIVTSDSGFLKAAICGNGQEPSIEGRLDASPAKRLQLLLNLRAMGDPPAVRASVECELNRIGHGLAGFQIDCFSPAAPRPERRVTRAPAEAPCHAPA